MSNLLLIEDKKKINRLYQKRFMAVAFALVSLVIFSGAVLILPTYIYSKSTEKILMEKSNSLIGKETSNLEKTLSASISDINAKLQIFGDKAQIFPMTKTTLEPVIKLKGDAISISQFSGALVPKKDNEIAISVSGIARNREALLAFSDRVSKQEGISSVTVPISSFLKNSNMSFTMNFVSKIK